MAVGADIYAYVYDSNGNLVDETTSRHFEWDYSDRMRVYRTQVNNSEPTVHAHYLYDASGQRVKKLVRKQSGKAEITVYIDGIFEHHHLIQGSSMQENNTLYVMDNQSRIALVRVGNPSPDDATPAKKYHLGDHLGSSNLVIDATGKWINWEEFTPYGETSFGGFARKRYRYTGKERDEESGLYYHGARYYVPWLGRWMSCDPAGIVDGINIYAYAHGNPVKLVDRKGTESELSSASKIKEAWASVGVTNVDIHDPQPTTEQKEATDADSKVDKSIGAGGHGLAHGSPSGKTLQVPDTYTPDKMKAYREGVLQRDIGRNAGRGNSTTLRRNSPEQVDARQQFRELDLPKEVPAPSGKYDVDHIIELQHDLTGQRGTSPRDYRWQDRGVNQLEGSQSWALNKNNPQGVPAGGVARVSEAGIWYNIEGFRTAGRGVGRGLEVYAVAESGLHIYNATQADIQQHTGGRQTAEAVASEIYGWTGAIVVGEEAALAGVACGPVAWACVPVFGLVGGAAGYYAGSSFVSSMLGH
jgi:RHS repeat-associated protein